MKTTNANSIQTRLAAFFSVEEQHPVGYTFSVSRVDLRVLGFTDTPDPPEYGTWDVVRSPMTDTITYIRTA